MMEYVDSNLCPTCNGLGIEPIPMGGTPIGPECSQCMGTGCVDSYGFPARPNLLAIDMQMTYKPIKQSKKTD